MGVKKIVIKIPDTKYLIGGAILLILLAVSVFEFIHITDMRHANARLKAEQQASLDALNAAKAKEVQTTTPAVPQPQNNTQPTTSSQPKSTFDCVGFNSSQRNLYVQAADALYSVYQSQKSTNQITYQDHDEPYKQQAISAANNLAYLNYQTKMDVNNNKYFNGLATNKCTNYYQKIPYNAA